MENNNMENVLQYINKNFITVASDDIKKANPVLRKVLDEITNALIDVNVLFKNLFETYIYGGSFFDGLKVSKPDEFDIDLKLYLPEILDIQIEPSDRDGFVYIKLKDWKRLTSDAYLNSLYKDLEKFKDSNNYLSQEKIKQWMQSIVTKAINKIKKDRSLDYIQLTHRVSGPAVTINVTHYNENMDIDLVPVFRIPGDQWPKYPVRQNNNTVWKDFLVVPKPPKDVNDERYWRLSFPEQEKEIIRELNFCKPAIRLLKKLRDTRTHNIPSYFIKTVFLWEIEKREENNDTAFWNRSLTEVFLHMLKVYKNYLEKHNIPYFWNENNNFLQHVQPINIENIKNYLDGMIKNIVRNMDSNPYIVAEYLYHVSQINIENIRNYLERMIREIERDMKSNPYIIAKHLLPSYELNHVKGHFSGIVSIRNPEPEIVYMREPVAYRVEDNSSLQTQQTSGISTGTVLAGAAAVGIGAALLFAYARHQRNQNN